MAILSYLRWLASCRVYYRPGHHLKYKTMKTIKPFLMMLLVLLAFTMSSCEVIGDIFKAGMWTALVIIVLIVLLITWLFRKFRR